jgi:hypothetical protein
MFPKFKNHTCRILNRLEFSIRILLIIHSLIHERKLSRKFLEKIKLLIRYIEMLNKYFCIHIDK